MLEKRIFNVDTLKDQAKEALATWEAEVAKIILEEGDYDLGDFDVDDIMGLRHMVAEDAAQTILDWMRLGEVDPGDMDGDHDSAMASAGWGTDEDYGYFGE